MEAFKHQIGSRLVGLCAEQLAKAWPAFDRERFMSLASGGLDALELKARVLHLASALEATLPQGFMEAASVVESALAPPPSGDELNFSQTAESGLAGWVIWPLGEWVVRRGLEHPQRALACLRELTQRSTAEFAIRPFIVRHPALVFDTLQRWCDDPSPHVRRLVSEGSRPRLPWGLRLQSLVSDPTPTLPLLRRLQDDPSAYVRRSVANHLNDIAKDHPGLVTNWVQAHLADASPQRQSLLRHASRTLIKHGDPRIMALWGVGAAFAGSASLRLSPRRTAVGGELSLDIALQSTSRRAQKLLVDYVVHHVKADGSTSPKVFKGRQLTLAAGESAHWVKRHSLRPVSTRSYSAGVHRIELQVNGRVVAVDAFRLLPA